LRRASGQTVGKSDGIRVYDLRSGPIGTGRAIGRYFRIIDDPLAGPSWMLWDS
jgi:hypothetical protein